MSGIATLFQLLSIIYNARKNHMRKCMYLCMRARNKNSTHANLRVSDIPKGQKRDYLKRHTFRPS